MAGRVLPLQLQGVGQCLLVGAHESGQLLQFEMMVSEGFSICPRIAKGSSPGSQNVPL